MSRAAYSILFTAPLAAISDAVAIGDVLIKSTTVGYTDQYVRATSANRGNRRSEGVALYAGNAGGSVEMARGGFYLSAEESGLAAGSAAWVRVSTNARLERVTAPAVADDLVGRCDTAGNVWLLPALCLRSSITVNIDDFGGDPTGVNDSADALEDAIESFGSSTTAGIVEFSATPSAYYRFSRKVDVNRPCILRGHGGHLFFPGTKLRWDSGKSGLHVWGGGGANPNGVADTVVEDLYIESAGGSATTTTASCTSGSSSVTVGSTTSFAVNDVVSIEASGPHCTLHATTAATTNGSATVTLSCWSDQVPVVRVGHFLVIGSAYPNPTKVTNVSGLTLTMASNAAATGTGTAVKYCAPTMARISTIVGTTVTLDTTLVQQTIAATEMRHADTGILASNIVKLNRVSIDGFRGYGITARGANGDTPSHTFNVSAGDNLRVSNCRGAIHILGADSNAGKWTINALTCSDWNFVDCSHLGQTFIGCHADGGNGYLSHDVAGCATALVGCYTEGGTFNSLGTGALIVGGSMPAECGGYSLAKMSSKYSPYVGISISGNVTLTAVSSEYYSDSIEYVGALGSPATVTFADRAFKPKWIWNKSGQVLNVKCALGNTVQIANNTGAMVNCNGSEIRRVTPDTAP